MPRKLRITILLNLACLIGWAQWPSYQDVTLQKGVQDEEAISYVYGNGAAIADFDMDGDLDFFLCTEAGIPDRLYINEDGLFEENAALYGLDSEQGSKVALWMDFDGGQGLGSGNAERLLYAGLQYTHYNKYVSTAAKRPLCRGRASDRTGF
jgi:hypothetical protein